MYTYIRCHYTAANDRIHMKLNMNDYVSYINYFQEFHNGRGTSINLRVVFSKFMRRNICNFILGVSINYIEKIFLLTLVVKWDQTLCHLCN